MCPHLTVELKRERSLVQRQLPVTVALNEDVVAGIPWPHLVCGTLNSSAV